MSGMHRGTGKRLTDEAHIAQSIGDILTTPVGSRVMRREYGSRLPELIDKPMNAATRLLMAAASAGAIRRWEPRVRLSRVQLTSGGADGSMAVLLTGTRTDLPLSPQLQLQIAL
ncbi:oxidoreductase [Sphingobium sp. SCG-1]|uniref:GPW/gp25 family protein n=1 Tax=Sphingobium sp. SCG-1 TaxID=2072936 RepID=UPI000CD6A7DA|nr:GPW/gp25 family protein [Sphingobium sp. SCG-1]AUW59433.1 oxidoreductase [Sphingobium sp. SCG-1]